MQRTLADVGVLMGGCRVHNDSKIWDAPEMHEIRDAKMENTPGGFNDDLMCRNRQELRTKARNALQKLESDGVPESHRQEVQDACDSALYHVGLVETIERKWKNHIYPVDGTWGADAKQKKVLKVVKQLWSEFSLPLHVSYKKLYTLNNNKTVSEKKKEKKLCDKSGDKDPERVQKTHRVTKRKTPEHKASNKLAARAVKAVVKAQVQRTQVPKGKKAKNPPRIGSDDEPLATGLCVLGTADNQLGRASILSLYPDLDMKGSEPHLLAFGFDDGVLVTITAAISGKGANTNTMHY
jgi:hypothetical protein